MGDGRGWKDRGDHTHGTTEIYTVKRPKIKSRRNIYTRVCVKERERERE